MFSIFLEMETILRIKHLRDYAFGINNNYIHNWGFINKLCILRRLIYYNVRIMHTPDVVKKAALDGDLDLVIWLLENTSSDNKYSAYSITADCSAMSGHLNIVKYLVVNNLIDNISNIHIMATKYGCLHILKWLHENCKMMLSLVPHLYSISLVSGHLHVIEWLYIKFPELEEYHVTEYDLAYIILNNHLHVLKYIHSVHALDNVEDKYIYAMLRSSDLAMVKWVYTIYPQSCKRVFTYHTFQYDHICDWIKTIKND